MKWFKKFEDFNMYEPTPMDSPKLTSYAQSTPNGMAGSYDNNINWKKLDAPLDNEFKRLSNDLSPSNKLRRRLKRNKRKFGFVKNFT